MQTNSYVVPPDKRAAHARLLKEFRRTMARLGCDLFEVYEQAGPNWDVSRRDGRFVQILRFRDRAHQAAVQAAEREDAEAQRRISEFCELINFPYQQEHGLFAVGFYTEMDPDEPIQRAAPLAQERPAAPPVPVPDDAAAADPDANAEHELDEIVASFGDPRELLDETSAARAPATPQPRAADANAGASAGAFPRLAQPQDDAIPATPPDDEELDTLLHEQFSPADPADSRDAHAADSELARVLDEGLADDVLDIAMPAELLEEDEMEGRDVRKPAPAAAAAGAPKASAEPARPSARKSKR